MHVGHRRILVEMVEEAKSAGALPVMLTFEPHPEAVMRPGAAPPLLTDHFEKARLIAEIGVEEMAVLGFTRELAAIGADDFITRILYPRLQPRRVFVGFNFTFGRGGRGNPGLLQDWSGKLGFRLDVFPPVTVGDRVVSSSAVREDLLAGNVGRAATALGRAFSLSGFVVRGEGRGRRLACPTANIAIAPGLCLPLSGVYAAAVEIEGEIRAAVVNIGSRPTFTGGAVGPPVVEAHVLDFCGDLYGSRITVHFLDRLRAERKFAGADALSRQIRADIEEVRGRFLAGDNATVLECARHASR